MRDDLEQHILARKWFYRYQLPSGAWTSLYIPDDVAQIHETRLVMMWSALSSFFEQAGNSLTAIDIASHQGFFSIELARRCRHVLGLEYQQRHVEAANLMKAVYQL